MICESARLMNAPPSRRIALVFYKKYDARMDAPDPLLGGPVLVRDFSEALQGGAGPAARA